MPRSGGEEVVRPVGPESLLPGGELRALRLRRTGTGRSSDVAFRRFEGIRKRQPRNTRPVLAQCPGYPWFSSFPAGGGAQGENLLYRHPHAAAVLLTARPSLTFFRGVVLRKSSQVLLYPVGRLFFSSRRACHHQHRGWCLARDRALEPDRLMPIRHSEPINNADIGFVLDRHEPPDPPLGSRLEQEFRNPPGNRMGEPDRANPLVCVLAFTTSLLCGANRHRRVASGTEGSLDCLQSSDGWAASSPLSPHTVCR